MKKALVLLSLFSVFFIAFANSSEPSEDKPKEVKGAILVKGTPIKRVPANVDFLLVIEENQVTIRIFSNLGTADYNIENLSSGDLYSGTIDSYAGYAETLYVPSASSSCINFDIDFEDGGSCHLSW